MRFLSFAVLAAIVMAVSVHAADKGKEETKKPAAAEASVVGNLVCSKCALQATEKCQTALLLATTNAQWGIVENPARFLTADERLGKARKLSRNEEYASSQLANKLGEKQFVLLSGKAGESQFHDRCSGKLVRVSGDLTLKEGVATITSQKSTEVKNEDATPGLTLAGKLVCSKCEFKIGKCAAGLKSGDLQVLLDGDAAKSLFKVRCSGISKVATGSLTRIDGNTVTLDVSRVADPTVPVGDRKTDSPKAKTD
ncbi:MAG: hypothetical protein H8E37_01060 [Planctomycetes bacterium]|nr:hypothetical protein [Planctomycetota bacterium]